MGRRVPKVPDLYQVLQVSPTAAAAEIRSAYRRKALICHPDKGGATESFQLLVHAFETLADDVSRANYDKKRMRMKVELNVAARQAVQVKRDQSVYDSYDSNKTKRKNVLQEQKETCLHRFTLRLDVGLERLRVALQMVDSAHRQTMINDLPIEVRKLLLCFMSREHQSTSGGSVATTAEGFQGAQHAIVLHETCTSDCDSSFQSTLSCDSGCDSECDPVSDASGKLALGDETKDKGNPAQGRTPASTDNSRASTFKGVEQGRRGKECLYRARLMFACLAFYTKYQPRLDVAVEHHILLVEIRQVAHSMGSVPMDATSGNRILSACQQVLVEAGTSIIEIGLHVHVRLSLLGHRGQNHRQIVVSSPVLPLSEAVSWRERLLVAKAEDWSSFRSVWMELLQHPSFKRGRGRSVATTKDVEQLDEYLGSRWSLLREQRAIVLAAVRSERLVAKAVKVLERILTAKAAAEVREARSAAKAAAQTDRERREKRRRWLNRKAGKDMTMDDLLYCMPDAPRS